MDSGRRTRRSAQQKAARQPAQEYGPDEAIDEAVAAFNDRHVGSPLRVGRADRQKGATYEIPAWVFEEISRSRLLLADLTDEKPNVYLEIGYALSKGVPVILTFHGRTGTPPWDRKDDQGNKVAFDIAAFRYVGHDSAMDLRGQLVEELGAFFAAPMPFRAVVPDAPSPAPSAPAPDRKDDEPGKAP
jgi:hypothetical protein